MIVSILVPNLTQDSISIRCIPATCQPYVFWGPPLGGLGPQGNKFEQVSSDDHEMSVAGW